MEKREKLLLENRHFRISLEISRLAGEVGMTVAGMERENDGLALVCGGERVRTFLCLDEMLDYMTGYRDGTVGDPRIFKKEKK